MMTALFVTGWNPGDLSIHTVSKYDDSRDVVNQAFVMGLVSKRYWRNTVQIIKETASCAVLTSS